MNRETPTAPTLLVGLGEFGSRVLSRVDDRFKSGVDAGAEVEDRRQKNLLRSVAAESIEASVPTCIEHARELLDVRNFVARPDPSDFRGPRLDVFIVCDASEDESRESLAKGIEKFQIRFTEEFQTIFSGHGRLTICPIVFVPKRSEGVETFLGDIETTLNAMKFKSRVFLLQDQSGKYAIPTQEITRTIISFLSLVLFTGSRFETRIRELLERDPESREAIFATFACGTLEANIRDLKQACAAHLSGDILTQFDHEEVALSETTSRGNELVPESSELQNELWNEFGDRQFDEYLKPPIVDVPMIDLSHEPEEIVNRLFGVDWQGSVSKKMSTHIERVETLHMPRIADKIYSNGVRANSRVEQKIGERMEEWLQDSPRGFGRALQFAGYALSVCSQRRERAHGRIQTPQFTDLGKSPLKSGVEGIGRATKDRPRGRPNRLRYFTLGAGVLTGPIIAGLVSPITNSQNVHPVLVLLVCFILSISGWSYFAWRYRRRHHNWVLAARDSLDQGIKRYLNSNVVNYFKSRLIFSRDLQVFRVLSNAEAGLEKHVATLEAIRMAMDKLKQHFADRSVIRANASMESGVFYRSVLSTARVKDYYDQISPPDKLSVANRYLSHVLEDSAPLEGLVADEEALWTFSNNELVDVSSLSPFSGGDDAISVAAMKDIDDFLCNLSTRISVPLNIKEAYVGKLSNVGRTLVSPQHALNSLKAILSKRNIDQGWQTEVLSKDHSRVHLLVTRIDFPASAVGIKDSEE